MGGWPGGCWPDPSSPPGFKKKPALFPPLLPRTHGDPLGPPASTNELLDAADNLYTLKDFLHMERFVLNLLQWQVGDAQAAASAPTTADQTATRHQPPWREKMKTEGI